MLAISVIFLASFLLLLLFFLSGASAIPGGPQIGASIENVNSTVFAGETARYNAVLINNEPVPVSVVLTISGPKADSWVQPYDYSVVVPAAGILKVPLAIRPLPDAAGGNYAYSLLLQAKISEESGWVQLENPPTLLMEVKQPTTTFTELGRIYLSIFDEKATYWPGDAVQVQAQIYSLKELFAQLDVNLQFLDSAGRPVYGYTAPVTSQKEPIKPISHNIPLSLQTIPGEYYVVAELVSDKGQVAITRRLVTVDSVRKTEQRRAVQTGFLSRKVSIYVENLGNIVSGGTVVERISWYEKFLLTASPLPLFVPSGGNALNAVWTYGDLAPGQRTPTYSYSISYLPLVLGAILAVLILVVVWQQFKPVSLSKEVIKQRIAQNVLEATLTLHAKNLTDKTVSQVALTDYVPNLAKAVEYGTAEPAHTRKERLETVLVWDLGDLKPGEERVVTYKIRTTVGVLGSIDLPAASIEFVTLDNKRKIVRSNTAECGKNV